MKSTHDKEEYRRAYAVKQKMEGVSYRTIAKDLNVNYRNVYDWIDNYRKDSLDGIRNRRKNGGTTQSPELYKHYHGYRTGGSTNNDSVNQPGAVYVSGGFPGGPTPDPAPAADGYVRTGTGGGHSHGGFMSFAGQPAPNISSFSLLPPYKSYAYIQKIL